ncbi:MAG: hypothetical protein GX851_04850 [Clostridiales bacterium]|nr:hypothetical protein [Clostridiales bacterium]
MKNGMSLKAKIRNIAKQKGIPAQVILQNYMFERLLVRLSQSEYKDKFVMKGGMLVASIVGIDNRATMDLDTTLRDLPLTPEAIKTALVSIWHCFGCDAGGNAIDLVMKYNNISFSDACK